MLTIKLLLELVQPSNCFTTIDLKVASFMSNTGGALYLQPCRSCTACWRGARIVGAVSRIGAPMYSSRLVLIYWLCSWKFLWVTTWPWLEESIALGQNHKFCTPNHPHRPPSVMLLYNIMLLLPFLIRKELFALLQEVAYRTNTGCFQCLNKQPMLCFYGEKDLFFQHVQMHFSVQSLHSVPCCL